MNNEDKKILFCSKQHFQILKGIAILAVMMGHCGNNSGVTWFTPLGGIGVAIFLFCSGYGIECSLSANRGGYWKRRFLEVYLEFFLIELISGIALKRGFADIVYDLAFIKISHPFGWYMQYLFVCYLIAWLVHKLKDVKMQAIVLVCLSIISLVVFFILNDNLRAEQSFSFTGGMLFSKYLRYRKATVQKDTVEKKQAEILSSDKRMVICGTLFLVLAILALYLKQLSFFRVDRAYIMIPLNLILKSAGAAGIIVLSYSLHRVFSLARKIGDLSYSLYLVHGYTFPIIADLKMGSWIMSAVLFWIVTFAVSLLWHLLFTLIKGRFKDKI